MKWNLETWEDGVWWGVGICSKGIIKEKGKINNEIKMVIEIMREIQGTIVVRMESNGDLGQKLAFFLKRKEEITKGNKVM